MFALTRSLLVGAAVACFALGFSAAPAFAAHHHKHKTHTVTHHRASGSTVVRIAQRHLFALGYYSGNADGVMGPQTRAAIKRFQREHGLKADGVLGTKTVRALENADYGHGRPVSSFGTHENVTSGDVPAPVSDDYATSMNGGTRSVSSRFARLDVSESGMGSAKRYNVNLNGQPILVADGQPSVIGMSQTYDLGNEDAVILTTFSPNDSGCVYRNHVLALSNAGSKMFDIDNCTRSYEAVSKNGSLWITFPQHDSNSAVGATWRLEGTSLQRL